MKYWDISPTLTPDLAVWPGDTPLSREVLCDIDQGQNIDLSTLKTTVHVGAHADAPHHYHRRGQTIEHVDLNKYMGPCYVQNVLHKKVIEIDDCKKAVELGFKRILFRTLSVPNLNHFNDDFTYFSPEAIEYMGRHQVLLVGIDTPSVDPFSSKDLPAHQKLFEYQIANLEGLLLQDVEEGIYELIALPLKLKGFDASPVRAILRPNK
jgi:arylformamidase